MMKHEKWYVPGYGTEKVGPFLGSLIEMVRPQKILEVGFGYTTPFLIESLKNNFELVWDDNCDPEYLKNKYDPKLVIIDNQSLEKNTNRAKQRRNFLKEQPTNLVDFIEGDFTQSSIVSQVKENYSQFDLCWFDCGGPEEYQFFIDNYFNMIKEFSIFHFTFFKGEENKNGKIISKCLSEYLRSTGSNMQRLDIIEPHKFKQGSITILRKVNNENQ